MSWVTGSAIVVGALLGVMALGVAVPALDTPSEQNTAWMGAAHQSNLAGIAAGRAAQDWAATDEVRALGAKTTEMHRSLNADLTAAAEALGGPAGRPVRKAAGRARGRYSQARH